MGQEYSLGDKVYKMIKEEFGIKDNVYKKYMNIKDGNHEYLSEAPVFRGEDELIYVEGSHYFFRGMDMKNISKFYNPPDKKRE